MNFIIMTMMNWNTYTFPSLMLIFLLVPLNQHCKFGSCKNIAVSSTWTTSIKLQMEVQCNVRFHLTSTIHLPSPPLQMLHSNDSSGCAGNKQSWFTLPFILHLFFYLWHGILMYKVDPIVLVNQEEIDAISYQSTDNEILIKSIWCLSCDTIIVSSAGLKLVVVKNIWFRRQSTL